MKTFVVAENDANQRIDKFLFKLLPNLSKNSIYMYIRKKRIKVNNKRVDQSYLLKLGDVLFIYINDEYFNIKLKDNFMAASLNLNIIYEDQNIILVNKPQGLVVHECSEYDIDTLINRVKHYLYINNQYLPQSENTFSPALCNRLDRNTCGIVIVAKNFNSLQVINSKMKNHEITKRYIAILSGRIYPESNTMTGYLLKDSDNNKVYIYNDFIPQAKKIITKYSVIKYLDNLSLVEIDLVTGRTHQIRAHFSYAGFPVLGDGKYGRHGFINGKKIKQQALCAYSIKFNFTNDSGDLSYLNGKQFKISNPWFLKYFI